MKCVSIKNKISPPTTLYPFVKIIIMLPEKLHIEQVSRFHNIVGVVDKNIDNESDILKRNELCVKFYKLDKLWRKLDEFIEFTLKHELDCLDLDDMLEKDIKQ